MGEKGLGQGLSSGLGKQAGGVGLGIRVGEQRIRAGASVWGQTGGIREAPQDEAGPSVLVSDPPEQHLLLGAEEGIFTLNRSDQEATLEMVRGTI